MENWERTRPPLLGYQGYMPPIIAALVVWGGVDGKGLVLGGGALSLDDRVF